jgi:capping protein beta
VPSLCEELLSSIDQPLKVNKDVASKREYLLCDYNRDGDSYRYVATQFSPLSIICLLPLAASRLNLPPPTTTTTTLGNSSPWSNKYDPPLEDGAVPSDSLRELELQANAAFDTYRELYFEGGVSSVYLWDLDQGFAGVVLIKKGKPTREDLRTRGETRV